MSSPLGGSKSAIVNLLFLLFYIDFLLLSYVADVLPFYSSIKFYLRLMMFRSSMFLLGQDPFERRERLPELTRFLPEGEESLMISSSGSSLFSFTPNKLTTTRNSSKSTGLDEYSHCAGKLKSLP